MQTDLFSSGLEPYKINKPVKLIELFGGYGSQYMAMKRLGVNVEHHKLCEWAIKSIQAYKDVHCPNDNNDYSKDLTVEEIKKYLFEKGISSNYNEPMSESQINRLNEEQVRTIYNNIQATHNLVNIQQVKGSDLEINDKDHYTYLLTYSFPCQDLSLAGKGAGMSDTSTRSGMLWEVERILKECKEINQLPDCLLMENVPQVHGKKNYSDWEKWLSSLEEMGYKNYWKDLIATDYGIPQTRKRTFMISILGNYSYEFPEPFELKLKLKDLLEDNVDESFYLSDKQLNDIQHWNSYEKPLDNMEKTDSKNISPTLTTRSGAYAAGMILVKNDTKQGYLEASDGDGVDISSRMQYHRGTVQKDKTQTLSTKGGENNGVVVMKRELCNELVEKGLVEEGDIIKHSYTTQIMSGNKKCVEKNDGTMITLTTRGDTFGVCVDNSMYTETEKKLFTEDGNIKRYIDSDIIDKFEEGQMATTTYPNGYGHGPRTHNESISLNTIDKPSVKKDLRIRKLTPRECLRLMGVSETDIDNMSKNQSNASLYHLAGDSIVVDVLYYIMKNLF